MQPKTRLLAIALPFLALILFSGASIKDPVVTPKKVTVKPCEATCQFSPTAGNFAAVNFLNCNGSAGVSSVTAGTSFIPILWGTGCITAVIDVNLPALHPAGTVEIQRGGTVVYSYTVAANEAFSISRKFQYICDDYYIVYFY